MLTTNNAKISYCNRGAFVFSRVYKFAVNFCSLLFTFLNPLGCLYFLHPRDSDVFLGFGSLFWMGGGFEDVNVKSIHMLEF